MAFFLMFDDDWLSQEGAPSLLPSEKQHPGNSQVIQALLRDGTDPYQIDLVCCPHCGKYSYYDGGFTSWCEWCGKLAVSPDSEDETLTLADFWGEDIGP